MYKFSYLKYLFIVIPGSIAGEYLHEWLHCKNTMPVNDNKDERKRMPWILLLTIGLIVFNLYGLYMRYLFLNLVGTIAILCVLYILLQVEGKNTGYWYKLFRAGTYLKMCIRDRLCTAQRTAPCNGNRRKAYHVPESGTERGAEV